MSIEVIHTSEYLNPYLNQSLITQRERVNKMITSLSYNLTRSDMKRKRKSLKAKAIRKAKVKAAK